MIKSHRLSIEKTFHLSVPCILCIGMVIGMVFFTVLTQYIQMEESPIMRLISYSNYLEMKNREYYFYLLKNRIKVIIGFVVCTIFLDSEKTAKIGIAMTGCCMGLLLCMCLKDYRAWGFFLWIAFQFPQVGFYLYAMHLWTKIDKKYLYDISRNGFNKTRIVRRILQYFFVILVAIVGIMCEFYVNTIIMENILKIFQNLTYKI